MATTTTPARTGHKKWHRRYLTDLECSTEAGLGHSEIVPLVLSTARPPPSLTAVAHFTSTFTLVHFLPPSFSFFHLPPVLRHLRQYPPYYQAYATYSLMSCCFICPLGLKAMAQKGLPLQANASWGLNDCLFRSFKM